MSKKHFDPGDRKAIARAWQSSALSQEQFSAEHGIRPRTLRAWVSRYAPAAPPTEEARRIIGEAMSRLQAILESLDAGPACREAREQIVVPLGMPTASNGSATQLRQAPTAAAPPARSPATVPLSPLVIAGAGLATEEPASPEDTTPKRKGFCWNLD